MLYDPSKLLVIVNGKIGVPASENSKFKEPFCDHIYRIEQLQLEVNVSLFKTDMASATDFQDQQRIWITSKSSRKTDFVPQNKISLRKSVEMYMTYEDDYIICKDASPEASPLCSTKLS